MGSLTNADRRPAVGAITALVIAPTNPGGWILLASLGGLLRDGASITSVILTARRECVKKAAAPLSAFTLRYQTSTVTVQGGEMPRAGMGVVVLMALLIGGLFMIGGS